MLNNFLLLIFDRKEQIHYQILKYYPMKIVRTLLLLTSIIFLAGACNCPDSKADSWSADQQTEWKSKCMKFMTEKGVEEKNATDFCDCMYEKTSDKYTPEEAENITADEERKLWNECDYSW
jgi:hypothetical protein